MNGPTERELALLALMMRHIDGQWTPRANIEIGGPDLPAWIRTALAGGGGGEKAETYWHGRFREEERDRLALKDRCASLESRLAAAEKRAEEAEGRLLPICGVGGRAGNAVQWMTRCHDAERERDALKAELAEAKGKAAQARDAFTLAVGERNAAESERDAALARVELLEAATASSVHIDMACIYVDGVKYTPEQVRSAVRRLATIRDAAGAQP